MKDAKVIPVPASFCSYGQSSLIAEYASFSFSQEEITRKIITASWAPESLLFSYWNKGILQIQIPWPRLKASPFCAICSVYPKKIP